jgi:hypothetical protein
MTLQGLPEHPPLSTPSAVGVGSARAGRESHDDVMAEDTMLFDGDDDSRARADNGDDNDAESDDDEPDIVSSRPVAVAPSGVQLGSSLPINIPSVGSLRGKRGVNDVGSFRADRD